MRKTDGKKPLEEQGYIYYIYSKFNRVQSKSRSCRLLSSLFPAMPRIVHTSQCWHFVALSKQNDYMLCNRLAQNRRNDRNPSWESIDRVESLLGYLH